jgi:ABC-2 type transport system ATP-binding protein
MTEAAPLLQASRITVRRNGRLILTGVGFTARAGEILGVIGPNGAGKTTLMEAVAGLTATDSASVIAAGGTADVFYLPDGIRPWPQQRVEWLLRFFAGAEIDTQTVEALQLQPLLGQRIGSLSKGEAKRVLLAVALSSNRRTLLLDEPFDGLDFRQTRQAADLLRRSVTNRAMILSIHQLSDAERVCDRFLLLDNGHALGEGTVAELSVRAGGSAMPLEEIFLALE